MKLSTIVNIASATIVVEKLALSLSTMYKMLCQEFIPPQTLQPLSAASQSLPPPPVAHTTMLHGAPVPNGPLRSVEVRGEAELVDVNDNDNSKPSSSLAVVKDPLLNLEQTGVQSAQTLATHPGDISMAITHDNEILQAQLCNNQPAYTLLP